MGASVRHADAGFDWAGLKAGFSAHPVLALIGIFLALLLVPLFLALFVMIGYLTALVMTMGLAAGLGLVLWLV